MKITGYVILDSQDDLEKLEIQVREFLATGWQLLGQPYSYVAYWEDLADVSNRVVVHCQAMIQIEE